MSDSIRKLNRRRILTSLALGAGGIASYGIPGASVAFAEELLRTPRQSAGPFYPKEIPLDRDNDLIIVGDSTTPAVGQITHLRGRVLSTSGEPIRNARVEIWQVDNNGVYQHTGNARRSARADKNFQGFGGFETGSSGEYYFRTIKPVSYPGRTAHIHFAVKLKGHDRWTTQCYVRGEARNERDWLFNRVKDPSARESVLVDFLPDPNSQLGEFNANFDIVLGLTPAA
jgi:protocatechuate 3,4-dioxygenase beta subunit